MSEVLASPSSNGSVASPPSTHELLRLRVQERLRRDGADDSAVHRTGTRDRGVVMAAIRDVVDDYQREADKGISNAGRLSNPDQTIARLERSLLEAGPLTKYFNNPERADEVTLLGGVITAIGRDGRLYVDPEPTCEAEMMAITARLLAEAGATVDLEHTIVVHQIWDNKVRASVSIPPTAEVLDCNFRIYRKQRTTFEDLVEWGSLTPPAANACKAFAKGKTRLVSGRRAGIGQVDVHVGPHRGDAVDDERPDQPEVPGADLRPAPRRQLAGRPGQQVAAGPDPGAAELRSRPGGDGRMSRTGGVRPHPGIELGVRVHHIRTQLQRDRGHERVARRREAGRQRPRRGAAPHVRPPDRRRRVLRGAAGAPRR